MTTTTTQLTVTQVADLIGAEPTLVAEYLLDAGIDIQGEVIAPGPWSGDLVGELAEISTVPAIRGRGMAEAAEMDEPADPTVVVRDWSVWAQGREVM